MRPSHRIKRLSTFWGQYLPLGPPPRRRHMDMDRDFRDARAAQIRAALKAAAPRMRTEFWRAQQRNWMANERLSTDKIQTTHKSTLYPCSCTSENDTS